MQIFFTDSKHTRQHDYLKLETRLLEPVYLTVIDWSSTKHRFLLLNHPCTGWFIQLDDKPLVNGLSCEKNTYTDRRNKLHHAKYFIPDIPRITRWVQQKLRRSTLVNRETFVETVYGGRAEEILRFIKFRSRNSAIHSLLYSRTTSGVPERLMVEYHPVHRMKARDRDRDRESGRNDHKDKSRHVYGVQSWNALISILHLVPRQSFSRPVFLHSLYTINGWQGRFRYRWASSS